jgi:hypothetical protein
MESRRKIDLWLNIACLPESVKLWPRPWPHLMSCRILRRASACDQGFAGFGGAGFANLTVSMDTFG